MISLFSLQDNVSEAEDMEEPPVLELSVPMSENMASFHVSLLL